MTSDLAHKNAATAGGFTLIELLVVLTVLALVASVSVFAARGRGNIELRSAAIQLKTDLEELRQKAIRQEAATQLAIADGAHAYKLEPYQLVRQLPAGTTLIYEPGIRPLTDSNYQQLFFFSDGSSSGGVLRLGRGSAGFAIRISWLNGDVSVSG